MKKIIMITALLFCGIGGFAQNKVPFYDKGFSGYVEGGLMARFGVSLFETISTDFGYGFGNGFFVGGGFALDHSLGVVSVIIGDVVSEGVNLKPYDNDLTVKGYVNVEKLFKAGDVYPLIDLRVGAEGPMKRGITDYALYLRPSAGIEVFRHLGISLGADCHIGRHVFENSVKGESQNIFIPFLAAQFRF